jgi:hypothetical protein
MVAAVTAALALALVPAASIAKTPKQVPGKVLKTTQVTFVNGTVLRVYASRVVHGTSATLYLTEFGHAKGKPFAYVTRIKAPASWTFAPDSQIYDFRLTRPPSCTGCTRFNANGAISWYVHADRANAQTHYWGAALHGSRLQWFS